MIFSKRLLSVSIISLVFVCYSANIPAQIGSDDAEQLAARGEASYSKGAVRDAVKYWEESLKIMEDKARRVRVLICLSDAYQAIGAHGKALVALTRAASIAENDREKALVLSGLGDLHLSLGETDKAREYLETALKIARSVKSDPILLASVLNNMGNALDAEGRYQESLSAYEECLEIIGRRGYPDPRVHEFQSDVLINRVRVISQTDDNQTIGEALNKARAHIESLSDSHGKAGYMLSLGILVSELTEKDILLFRNFGKASYDLLSGAKRIAAEFQDFRILSYADGYTGRLYEREGRYSEAVKLTRSAIFSAQQGNYPEILYLWHWQLGRILKAEGDTGNAVSAYRRAISVLNPIRYELFRGYRTQKETFSERVRPVYLELAELLLDQAENFQRKSSGLGMKAYEEKLRDARDTMELLKTAELQDFFEDECVMAAQKKSAKLDRAPAGSAVLYPIPLKDSLALLLTLPDCMKQIRVSATSEQVIRKARQFRIGLQTRPNYNFREPAEQLYDWLIRPLESTLSERKIDTLIILPDSALRLIPFAALHDRERYLIEKYAVVTAPAVTLTDPREIETENARILLAGLSEARQEFPPLRYVPAEISNISKIMGGKILQDKDYTIEHLTDEFRTQAYTIVHLATHGQFGRTPEKTFLLTYNNRLTIDMLEQLIGIGRFREQPLELLTLSACQTAVGDERAALGLAGIAIKAGARSALATLWFVDDEATSVAVTEFYRNLEQSDTTKAKALQHAQKHLISQIRFRHPIYWSPFLLIGNWK